MPETPDLTALLGSRICHDLISPIGAIGNGVELLMMDGSSCGPEIALIAESVANANARIRFFRIAFGAASADQHIGRAEVTSILSDLTCGGRLVIDWQSPPDLPRREAKLAFLLIQCLETAMPFGGRITVGHDAAAWTLTGQAPRMKVDADLWRLLSNRNAAPAITAAQVHFALVPEALRRHQRALTIAITETEISLTF